MSRSRLRPLKGSLRLRLLAAVGLVVVAAVAAVGLMSTWIAKGEVHRYLTEADGRRVDAVAESLRLPFEEHHRTGRGWDGAGDLVGRLAADHPEHFLLLLDVEYRVLSASDPWLRGALVQRRGDGLLRIWRPPSGAAPNQVRSLELLVASGLVSLEDETGETVGHVLALPRPEQVPGLRPVLLVTTIERRVLWAVVGAGLVAMLATWWISSRILSPVSELIRVAREFEQGRLDRRVRVRSGDEIGRLGVAFNAMAEGLERLEKLRSTMMSDAAHELRTPLTGIRCQLEALQDGLVRPDPKTFDSLHEDVMTLQRLVEDLQDLAVAEAGGLSLELEPIDVRDAIAAVARSYSNGKGPRLAVEIPDLPPILADPTRLQQILRNLLDNALRHTPEEGWIRLSAARAGDRVEICVADSGPGIEAEHLGLVFERFYRADPSRQRETGGAGLGLAIVKQLVEAQAGEVRVESTPGQGARFTVCLPVAGEPGSARSQPRT